MIQASEFKELKNPLSNAVVSLAVETVKAGYGTLIFCSARQGCQSTALLLSQVMSIRSDASDEIWGKRKMVISELRALSVGLDEILEKTIIKGVAFHRQSFFVCGNLRVNSSKMPE